MKQQLRKIVSLALAVVILVQTTIVPTAAAELEVPEAEVPATEAVETSAEPAASEDKPVTVVGELEELRGENSKQFLLSDGTVALAQYDTDVHYQDENGVWQEIDNTLTAEGGEDPSDASDYSTTAGRVNFKFAKNANANFLVRIRQGKYHLFFSLQNAQKKSDGAKAIISDMANEDDSLVGQMEAEHVRSAVVYQDILSGTDIEYITSGSSLKENIVVKEQQTQYQYVFEIKTNKLEVRENGDGSIAFVTQDTGEVLYTIPAMYMTDAAGNVSDAVTFSLSTKNKKSILTITADTEWINGEDRVFPVTIDPTLEASSASTGAETFSVGNQYVAKGNPNTTHNGNSKGFLGYGSGSDKTYRLFVQLKNLPEIPDDSVIVGARFYFAQLDYDHVQMPGLTVAAHEVTGTWAWDDNLNWNNQPSFSDTVLDYQELSSDTSGTYVGWDITRLIKTHYEERNDSDASTAFALVSTEESSFHSNKRAKAEVAKKTAMAIIPMPSLS